MICEILATIVDASALHDTGWGSLAAVPSRNGYW